ncbi:MAG: RnfH family protein [Arenicella sp.]|nr:RnfH family protein [Arenicella sp.]
MTEHSIEVAIVYATRDRQWLKEMHVARGTNAQELVVASGLLQEVEALRGVAVRDLQLGVYAQKVPADYMLEQGDRVEIYRPLRADPKEVRRQLALLGKTMGRGPVKNSE